MNKAFTKLDKWLTVKITPRLLWITVLVSTVIVLLGNGLEKALFTLVGMSGLTFAYGLFVGYGDKSTQGNKDQLDDLVK